MRNWVRHAKREAAFISVVLSILVVSGCGGGSTVTGKVSYKGNPVRAGNVIFMDGGGQVYRTDISDDGTYTLVKVPPGTYRIGVRPGGKTGAPMPSGPRQGPPKDAKMGGPPKDVQVGEGLKTSANMGPKEGASDKFVPIPDNLQDPEKSGLSVTVGSGRQTHDIDLK
jgi:hypothetical protein